MKKFFAYAALLMLLVPSLLWAACPGSGATRTTASCTAAEIQECHDVEGVTVINVPTSTCTWTTTDQVSITKYIAIRGAGIDSTVITDNTTRTTFPWTISVTSASDGVVEISGFTFSEAGAVSSNPLIQGGVCGANTGGYVHIKNNKFNGVLRQPFIVSGLRGLFSGNTFLNTVRGKVLGVSGDWDANWTGATSLGSVNAWYFEDNTWTTPAGSVDGLIDCEWGGRYVARYNTITINDTHTGSLFFGHGLDTVYRGCQLIEIYNNNATCADPCVDWHFDAFLFRGGTGIVANNTLTGKFFAPLSMIQHRSCDGSIYYPSAVGLCSGGTQNGEVCSGPSGSHTTACTGGGGTCDYDNCNGNNVGDGNTGLHGYPCRDGLGRGGDQALAPLYQWGNTLNSGAITWNAPVSETGCETDYISEHVIENRDYYNAQNMAYTPYTYPHPLRGEGATTGTHNGISISGGVSFR